MTALAPSASVLFGVFRRVRRFDVLAIAVAVAAGLAVAVDAEFFEELAGDFAGVFALGVAGAAEEVAAAAGADGHRLAALVAVDVGDGAVDRLRAGGGGVFAEDLCDQL